MTARRWCWTLNNYSEEEISHINKTAETCRYLCYGKEISSTGTPHLQGFLITKNSVRLPAVKKILSVRAHIEKARGTSQQAATYCKKENDFTEFGKLHEESGTLEDATELCSSDTNGYELTAQTHPTYFVKYWRGFKELHHLASPIQQRDHITQLYVIIGPTGTGKSMRCNEVAKELGSVYYKNRGQWWDAYKQEKCVIIDDFYGWIKWDELLKITDRYPYKVQYKGGSTEFTSHYIFITSNADIPQWYKFQGYDPAPLYRRCTAIIKTDPDIAYGRHAEIREELDNIPNEIKIKFSLLD